MLKSARYWKWVKVEEGQKAYTVWEGKYCGRQQKKGIWGDSSRLTITRETYKQDNGHGVQNGGEYENGCSLFR